MVFLHDWEEFEHAAETMYQQSPEQCRYTMKYTHKKGQLVLKLTDNVKVSAAPTRAYFMVQCPSRNSLIV